MDQGSNSVLSRTTQERSVPNYCGKTRKCDFSEDFKTFLEQNIVPVEMGDCKTVGFPPRVSPYSKNV